MILYAYITGAIGEAYERCYVWAGDRQEADRLVLEEARKTYSALTLADVEQWQVERLFGAEAAPFCSRLSDSGFDRDE